MQKPFFTTKFTKGHKSKKQAPGFLRVPLFLCGQELDLFLRKIKTFHHKVHKGSQKQKASAWFPSCTFVPLWSGT
jgi:hypothetical protein